jgi:hypothetical protein
LVAISFGGVDGAVFVTDLEQILRAEGLVDTHYHVGPELFPRRYDVLGLAQAAKGAGMTLVLKNHTYPTSPLASLAREHFGARLLGGVVLNRFVGGLNADAVLGAASGNHAKVSDPSLPEPTFMVWMPTVHAVSHLRTLGKTFDSRWWGTCSSPPVASLDQTPVVVFDDDLKPAPNLEAVLDTIAACGARLATGHLSAEEIMRLVPMALERGVQGVVLTHPHYPSVRLSDAQLKTLCRDPRVFIEHCFAIHTIEEVPLEDFASSIRATGPEQVILSTDFGQVHSDPAPEGSWRFAELMKALVGDTYGMNDMVQMMCRNPRRVLGLQ